MKHILTFAALLALSTCRPEPVSAADCTGEAAQFLESGISDAEMRVQSFYRQRLSLSDINDCLLKEQTLNRTDTRRYHVFSDCIISAAYRNGWTPQ
jgi:hypothetical protein